MASVWKRKITACFRGFQGGGFVPKRDCFEICRDPKGTVVDFCYHPVLTECPQGRFPKIHYMHSGPRVPAVASIEAR